METPLVSSHPEVMSGALCFAGTRVPVKNLFDYLEGSSTLEDFPSVSRARAVTVLEAARHFAQGHPIWAAACCPIVAIP